MRHLRCSMLLSVGHIFFNNEPQPTENNMLVADAGEACEHLKSASQKLELQSKVTE